MKLQELYEQFDEREKGQDSENESLDISPEDVTELQMELSSLSNSDIPEKYRADILNFLESSLLYSGTTTTEINTSLIGLVSDLKESQ